MKDFWELLGMLVLVGLIGLLVKNAGGVRTVIGAGSSAFNSALSTATFQGGGSFMTPGFSSSLTGLGG